MNAAEVVLVYVCIPGGVVGILASLVFLPGLTRRPKYRPGDPWPHEPVFYGPHIEMLDEELQDVLTGLAAHGWLADDAVVVVERGKREPWEWPERFAALRDRKYGEARLWYGHRHG